MLLNEIIVIFLTAPLNELDSISRMPDLEPSLHCEINDIASTVFYLGHVDLKSHISWFWVFSQHSIFVRFC